MTVELKGILKIIYKEEKVSDNLSKKEVVITVDHDTQYPQDILCSALNTQIDQLDHFKMGDFVIIKCSLKGREYNGKYYNQLNLFNVQKVK